MDSTVQFPVCHSERNWSDSVLAANNGVYCDSIVYAVTTNSTKTEVCHHYTNLTVVRESVCLSVCDREVNGSNSNRAKKFFFSASLGLDVTTCSPLTTQRRH